MLANTEILAMPHLLCIGYGYCAQAVSALTRAGSYEVSGTKRNATLPLISYVSGENIATLAPHVAVATHILISTPPQNADCSALIDLASLPVPKNLQWLGYCSTTGVYGDYKGEWVNETSELRATEPRSLWRIADEGRTAQLWPGHQFARHIFRLAGIYGPGRNALESVMHGTAQRIDKPGQYFSRVHVNDIAHVIWCAMQQRLGYEIFNVADDAPTAPADPVTYACELLGITPPPLRPYHAEDASPMMRSFYSASRKVRNDKIKATLNVQLQFPTYREGLLVLYASTPTSPAAKASALKGSKS
jgi:hypothetical protein